VNGEEDGTGRRPHFQTARITPFSDRRRQRPLKVTSNGITLRFGNQAFNYRNEETGRLRGQTVLA
jgi:hypothetical protein